MAELLGRAIPAESAADCRSCVMVAGRDGNSDPGRRWFDPVTRCCTYLPELPNYLVGRILADPSAGMAAGRRSVESRIDCGVAVTPLGLGKHDVHTLLYVHGADGFGASRTLRCPHHLDDGGCGIWQHRMSVCATWFCKHVRGALGQRFWRAVQALLSAVERDLARWCLLETGLGPKALASLLPPPVPAAPVFMLDRYQLDGRVDPRRYAAAWGERAGRERAYYRRCAELVQDMGWRQVLAVCGPEVTIRARQARDAFREVRSRGIPPRLRVGDYHIVEAAPEASLVASYSGFDPLRLPAAVLEALPFFDGRPAADALRTIERKKRLRFDRELVRKLIDFAILVPVPERGRPGAGSPPR